jgi:hypothetical protein
MEERSVPGVDTNLPIDYIQELDPSFTRLQ